MSTLEKKVQRAIKLRERLFQRVQQCHDLIKHPNLVDEFLARAQRLNETYQQFQDNNDLLEELSCELETSRQIEILNPTKEFETLYYQAKSYEAIKIKDSRPSPSDTQKIENVKLPVINIPTFEGDILQFQSWRTLYDELIHNSNMSEIQKFSYFKSYLKGSASLVIKSIAFTANNYALAYQTIVDRFSKTRNIASSMMKKLINFQPLNNGSITSLNSFLDHFVTTVESLKSLDIEDLKEFILLHLALNVLDSRTTLEFETEVKDIEFPTFNELVNFIRSKASILQINSDYSKSVPSSTRPKILVSNVVPSTTKGNNRYSCALGCSEIHPIIRCPRFKSKNPEERFKIIKSLKLCLACFSHLHVLKQCKSTKACKVCSSKYHNTMLHKEVNTTTASISTISTNQKEEKPPTNIRTTDENTNEVVSALANHQTPAVLLGTAMIQVQDVYSNWHPVRCILDSGSQVSAITEHLGQLLQIPRRKSDVRVSGIGASNTIEARGEVTCSIMPHTGINKLNKPFQINAFILKKITVHVQNSVSKEIINQYSHLPLADTSYLHTSCASAPIDMLIGAEHYAMLMDPTLSVIQGFPSAIPTKLGWLLIGKIHQPDDSNQYHSLLACNIDSIENQLQRFWELEEVETSKPKNPDDEICEEHFRQTFSRSSNGQYVLRLPFKETFSSILCNNRQQAISRLSILKCKLGKNPQLKTQYFDAIDDYIKKGHMIPATTASSNLLIHHCVLKESSTTTKLRVVFDPNIKGTNGASLAQSLLVGPKLQSDISDLLLNFRLNEVALTCDIQSMYRSIRIAPDDQQYQHLLWFGKDQTTIQEYQLTTVTFGLPPSPFQAQRVLQQLVCDEGSKYPLASNAILHHTYVDDIVTGGHTVEDVILLREQLVKLLTRGGFHLRKFVSSHPQVISDLPQEVCELPHDLGCNQTIKLLGVKWNPTADVFFYSIAPQLCANITKRQILGCVSSIYDVNGYLGPVTIWIKIFLQKLWLDKSVTWDSSLCPNLQGQWSLFASELPKLSKIQIPRYILVQYPLEINLIGFCDASNAAYAAVVYLRVVSHQGVSTQILRAKSKVAPLKVITINRLELCAALLLAKTIRSLHFLKEKLSISNTILFSDSRVVLSWLRTPPHQLKTYVANRVAQIVDLTIQCKWQHVSSKKNSADLGSRGLMPSYLLDNQLWFYGPSFLETPIDSWPSYAEPDDLDIPETKEATILVTELDEDDSLIIQCIQRQSSLTKLQRIIAYVLRFIDHCRQQPKKSCPLTVVELNRALDRCIQVTQRHHMSEEIHIIKTKGKYSNYLAKLSPIITSFGILAVGGRLSQAPLPDSAKHPVIIPKQSHLAILLILHYHSITLHGGPKLIQTLIQRRYWIIGSRSLIRSVLSKCITCIKRRPLFKPPFMADLPVSRFNQGRPFLNVGVDMAGPYMLKTGIRRNSPITKAYFAIFICFATKAIHLELVTSLSTQCFLFAFDRFIGRRGLPSQMFSDNGTNFKGAARHMDEISKFFANSTDLSPYFTSKNVQWHFNPPHAPHFGGLWEAGVKSVKHHLKAILGERAFNHEEFNTMLVQVESILNSRPLCALPSSPDDGVDVLTPGHFIIGAPLLSRPESDQIDSRVSLTQRWSLIQQSINHFWKRWRSDYLNTLIQRSKWTQSTLNFKINDIVILKGEQVPHLRWPLGKIIQIIPGADGVVRVVKVKTSQGEFTRPVTNIVLLPILEDSFPH